MMPFEKTGLNIYDIRMKCDPKKPNCYSIMDDIDLYLNRRDIQEIIGVNTAFKGCSTKVGNDFVLGGDELLPYHNYVSEMLEAGIKVLVYAG
jgi:cathepsin A (carboxypeptidase C)